MREALDAAWIDLRYRRLLPLAGRSRSLAAAYAQMVALYESSVKGQRRRVARGRISRWLGVGRGEAARIHRKSLESEAREEADSRWFMDHPQDLAKAFDVIGKLGGAEPAIWVTLHLGAPILAYIYLSRMCGLDVRIIGRALDDSNPMPAAKREWGRRKVAWAEELSGHPFLGIDGASIMRAREHLLRGGSLFAAIDVPGDVIGRSAELRLFGEHVRIACGVSRLAGLAGAPLRPIVAVAGKSGLDIRVRADIEARGDAQSLAGIAAEIEAQVLGFPREWWLWPYLPTADGRAIA